MKILDCIACLLVIIGALNWGLVGIFDFNFVEEVCDAIVSDEVDTSSAEGLVESVGDIVENASDEAQGKPSMLERLVYIVVGASAVFMLLRLPAKCGKKSCG